MTALEIIGVPPSAFVRTVRMACAEKGVNYTLLPARPHSPDVDAVHPFGKVPVMRHGDFALFESKAIASYIDKAFDGPKLFPDDPKTHALIEQWVSVFNTTIAPDFFLYLRANFFPSTADGKADLATIAAITPKIEIDLGVLDHAVGTALFRAFDFTYVDMAFLPWLDYLRQTPESSKMLEALPMLTDYFETRSRRQCYKDAAASLTLAPR